MAFVPQDGKSQKCKGCNKTVYPNEWVKAISFYWHKGCLKCTQCQCTLNLRNVESFEQKPYCRTHRPAPSHTQVQSVTDRTAVSAPKRGRQAGIDQTARRTFAPGSMQPIRGARGRGRGGPARGGPARGGAAGGAGGAAPRPANNAGAIKVGGGGSSQCPTCNKRVYPQEMIRACGAVYHKQCLRCNECKIVLNLNTVVAHQGTPYCKTHRPVVKHTQVQSVTDRTAVSAPKRGKQAGIDQTARRTFAPGSMQPIRGARGRGRGGAAGGGGGAPRAAPAPAGAGGGAFKAASNAHLKCSGCGKTAYDNEAIKAAGGRYHKQCLKCTECGIVLNLKTCQSLQNKPYCNVHLPAAKHTQVQSYTDRVAANAPKASKQAGIQADARRTFAPGEQPAARPAEVYSAESAAAPAPDQKFEAPPVQESLTYDEPDSTYHGSAESYDQEPPASSGGYDDGGYDAAPASGGYDDAGAGGYDAGGYDDGGYSGYEEPAPETGGDSGYGDADSYDYPEEPAAPAAAAPPPAEDAGGYDEGGYDDAGYADEGYADEGGYTEEGGYADEGYAEEGYAEEGYAEEGYAEEGYAEEGYAEEGGYGEYDEGGYDEYEGGYDEYDEGGYDEYDEAY